MHQRGLLVLLTVSCALTVVAHAAPTHATLPLDDSAWHDGPAGLPAGGRFAVISGDPAKAGPFVIRVELPPGYAVAPYRRPRDESIVVLAGTIEVGIGDTVEPTAMRTLPSGSFVRLPAHELHFMSTQSGATVQIFGTGPFKQLSTSASNGAPPRIGSATGNPSRAISVASNR